MTDIVGRELESLLHVKCDICENLNTHLLRWSKILADVDTKHRKYYNEVMSRFMNHVKSTHQLANILYRDDLDIICQRCGNGLPSGCRCLESERLRGVHAFKVRRKEGC